MPTESVPTEPDLRPDASEDAAQRFYERNHALMRGAAAARDQRIDERQLRAGNHRYSAAYNYLQEHPGLRVLELGYGGPGIVGRLAPMAETYDVVDIVDRIEPAHRPANLTVHQSNLDNRFPFADATFDVVVAMMVIEHLYDPFHAFAEVARVVKPGGAAFVNLPNVGSLRCRLQLLGGKLPVTSQPNWFEIREWDGGHLHYFTVAEVKRLAALSGLKVTGVCPVGSLTAVKRLRPSLFCHEITYCLAK